MSLGNISFPRYEQDYERTLADLAPELVYASTDLMGTGGNIVQVQRASNSDTEDFTGAELYDGTYASFISGTTGKITKIYNQGAARGSTPNRDLSQDVSANQPVVDIANKRFIFNDAFVYSPEFAFGGGQGNPSITSSIFFASRIFVPETNTTQGRIPLLSIYNAETGGISLSYGFEHKYHHRQITYNRTGTDSDVYGADDSGGTPTGYYPVTTTYRAEKIVTNSGDTKETVFGRNISTTSRSIQVPPSDAVANNSNTGSFNASTQSDDKIRWGIGGYKTQSTTKDIGGDFSLYASIAFKTETNSTLSSADVTDLTRILGDL